LEKEEMIALRKSKSAAVLRQRGSKNTKLACACILGEGNDLLDENEIKKVIESVLGVYCFVSVQIENANLTRIEIRADDEILDQMGIMQLSLFEVLKALNQDAGIRILNVENEFIPHYA
jgi:hypothetical protein